MLYKLSFHVPELDCERIKEILFESGAGKYKNYQRCSWQIKGEGQFEGLENSNPSIGDPGKLTRVSEYKVEMVCSNKCIKKVVEDLKQHHPYEEVSYAVVKIEEF